MGDIIEGPDIARTDPRKKANREILGTAIVAGAVLTGVALAFIAFQASERAEKEFSDSLRGRCFVTAAGAAGMVESGAKTFDTATLIFPSGNKAKYSLEGLKERDCGELGLPKRQ